jgi:hypothetical protein
MEVLRSADVASCGAYCIASLWQRDSCATANTPRLGRVCGDGITLRDSSSIARASVQVFTFAQSPACGNLARAPLLPWAR